MKNMMDIINQIQEESRNKRLSAAYAMYKELKIEVIENIINKIEGAIVFAMLEGMAYTNINLNQQEFSHEEEISKYFEDKGFKVYCDKFYNEDGTKEYFMHISWGSRELNFQ
jgi:hypothetical protein